MARKKKSGRGDAPHRASFAAIEANYRHIEDHRAQVFTACRNDAERQDFFDTYHAARDTYWTAVAARLEDNHAFVQALRKDLQEANRKVKAELKQMKTAARVLKLMTEATRLAASLATVAKI